MINILKEVCVGNYSEARRAILNQADRVELCDNLSEGGTTPSYGTIKQTLQLTPNIVVMIRPRGGDFHYSDDEFKIMQEDILACKSLKVPSVVFGILKATSIDMERMQQLVSQASPMECVFHMAFDEVDDFHLALEQLISLKIKRVLTKGGKVKNAIEGRENIKLWLEKYGHQIEILPGGGLTHENYQGFIYYTKACQVHGTKILKYEQQ